MTALSLAEKPPSGEDIFVPEGWALWRNGSDTTSMYWTAVSADGQRASTLPSLDEPRLVVHSPVERTYPGIYFTHGEGYRAYLRDLELDVLMPTSLDYMQDAPPATETDHLLQARAISLYERNQRQLHAGDGNLYIPDGEALVKVAEPERQNDADPRRIVYVPEPFYGEYHRLQAQPNDPSQQ